MPTHFLGPQSAPTVVTCLPRNAVLIRFTYEIILRLTTLLREGTNFSIKFQGRGWCEIASNLRSTSKNIFTHQSFWLESRFLRLQHRKLQLVGVFEDIFQLVSISSHQFNPQIFKLHDIAF